ncbi:MAG: hypothetical protein NVSMB4_03460 [Acidimicrobiales bacterium]
MGVAKLEQRLCGAVEEVVGVLNAGEPDGQGLGELVERHVADPDAGDFSFFTQGDHLGELFVEVDHLGSVVVPGIMQAQVDDVDTFDSEASEIVLDTGFVLGIESS